MSATTPHAEFFGVWTALATPFRDDGSLDMGAYENLLAKQEQGGVAGVVISGTTGESPTLTVPEKLSLIRKARAFLGKRVRVMAGTGDNNTQQSVELSKLAQDAGADSLLVVTPPYNKPSLAGLANHYRSIASAVQIPICLYHVPSRTAQSLTVEQMTTLCSIPGIACVKEASADVAYFSRALHKAKIPFLVGDDSVYLGTLAVGGKGIISVISNLFPAAMVALTAAVNNGDLSRARALHYALLPSIDALFCEANPGPLKAALAHFGWAKNTVRPPLAPITESSQARVIAALRETGDTLQGLLQQP